MINKIIVAGFLLLIFSSCSDTNRQIDVSDNWEVFKSDNYSISYPSNWEVKGSTGFVEFFITSPLDCENDKFSENINLMIQDLSAFEMSMDEFVEVSEKQVKSLLTNGEILVSKRNDDFDLEFHIMVYSGTQGQFELTTKQYLWLLAEKAYILTFSCETDQVKIYNSVSKQIMDSFKISSEF